ncbi:hypothetical protein AX777_20555 [Sphingobium yanoikuyae]|uniref:SDR family oxidoreductase n=1 Tax=Sphingobium yanoikuyae TaxID=13690 RepID=A0A177JWG2_SPHYA|nr:SDR family oxidoreductase [Sphingobium yanoikuyae]OAH44665.1 hypothetical protein AX777_20555 [Sphingobium yanoikuyae]
MVDPVRNVAVVTGGGSGMGQACAELLAERGDIVVILDRNAEKAGQVAQTIGGHGFEIDIADHDAVEALADRIEREVGPVTKLVNCAGIAQTEPAPPEDLSFDVWDAVLRINLRGTYVSCKAFGSRMAKRGGGSIVNISSMAGMRSMPLHAYGPSKAAVINLSEGLAAEWGMSGVRVNVVAPGHVLTPMLQETIDNGTRDLSRLLTQYATGRVCQPVQVARVIAFLLSDEADSITGVTLPVDNGFLVAATWQGFGGVRPSRVTPTPAGEDAR